ncbi:methylaspartate mutase subunit S [Rubripirellula tenax]|uniref:Methylaspartate mutase subunit S n=1 Tax=Rubripirellula tenax TaxID=2528015 RepID=A0A5C6EFT0_9BACT|nr:cobalamin-dependent protein [Rubripirellula tenax]TWU47365.1 methylaspartate mutase subunit S [Rubripirellula tenax]
MAAHQPQYSPKQISEALLSSESSVKRWCDSGAIPTVRTAGGHRRITLDGLQHYLRTSGRALVAPEVLGLPMLGVARCQSIPGESTSDSADFCRMISVGDEAGCRRLLRKRLQDGGSRSEVVGGLVTEAMHEMGDAWKSKEVDPYQERRACAICIRLIDEMKSELPSCSESAPTAIGGTPSGDPYQVPTALVDLALRESGWNTINLGSDLPLESFRQAAFDHDAKLVWMSVSSISNATTFVAEEVRFAGQLNDDVTLIMGGRALTDSIRSRMRYTAHCDNLQQLSALAAVMLLDLAGN